ncbi:MAG: hypothetical protein WDW36_004007 [Sanguina aurantia]
MRRDELLLGLNQDTFCSLQRPRKASGMLARNAGTFLILLLCCTVSAEAPGQPSQQQHPPFSPASALPAATPATPGSPTASTPSQPTPSRPGILSSPPPYPPPRPASNTSGPSAPNSSKDSPAGPTPPQVPPSHPLGVSMFVVLSPPSAPHPSPPPAQPSQLGPPPHPPPVVIRVSDEEGLAHAISDAAGPGTTVVLLPPQLTLTMALPSITAPFQLASAGGVATVTCATNAPALTILSESFSMSGITWEGCSGVLHITGASHITVDGCRFQDNTITGATQGASCIDASGGFSGILSITASSFTANNLPVAIACTDTDTKASSCNVSVVGTDFRTNTGQSASAVQLDCGAVLWCKFAFNNCTFAENMLAANSINNATASAVIVTATATQTPLTMSVVSCKFSDNDGAGLSAASGSGVFTVQGCSFLRQQAVVGGLHALFIASPISVVLSGSTFVENTLGALALSNVQTSVVLSECTILDNEPNPATLDTVDITMADINPSSVLVSSCSFVNNSGYSFMPPYSYQYFAAGAMNIQSNTLTQATAVSVVIQDSSFLANYGFLMPGAVSIFTAATVNVTNTTASSNVGGAFLFSVVTLTSIQNSTFLSNFGTGKVDDRFVSVGGGGLSFLSCPEVQVSDCLFRDNAAINAGGAIVALYPNLPTASSFSVDRCTFINSTAISGSGGAIMLYSVGSISISQSSFTDCGAAVAGGSLCFLNAVAGGARITDCTFTGSTAGMLPPGGWLPASDATLGPGDVAARLQLQGGGAIFISQDPSVVIQRCVFHNCSAVRSRGGGLRLRGAKESHIDSCSFEGCSSAAGGAMALSSRLQTVGVIMGMQDNTFSNNVASNQLACPAAQCIDMDATLMGTVGDGGAMSVDGCDLSLYTSNSFTLNVAYGRGGAIFAQRPSDTGRLRVVCDASGFPSLPAPGGVPYQYLLSFVRNRAHVAGGAMALHGYLLSIPAPLPTSPDTYTLFYQNSAPAGGAVSMVESPGALISNALFLENQAVFADTPPDVAYACAGGHGGALCIFGTTRSAISVRQTVFLSNRGTFGGGVSLQADPSCTSQQLVDGCFSATFDSGCSFGGNEAADGAGGALFWTHPGNLNISCSGEKTWLGGLASSYALPAELLLVLPCSEWMGNQATGMAYGNTTASSSFFINPITGNIVYYSSNQPLALNVSMQLQLDVSQAYYRLQYGQAVGGGGAPAPVQRRHQRRRLSGQAHLRSDPTVAGPTQRQTVLPQPTTPRTASTQHTQQPIRPLPSSLRALLQADPTSPAPSLPPTAPGTSDTSTSTATPGGQEGTLVPVSAEVLFNRLFLSLISANLTTYSSTQCAQGHTGRLCAQCSPGYGTQGIATCKACHPLNPLYYSLATVVTLLFLAWTFHGSFGYIQSMNQRQQAKREQLGARASDLAAPTRPGRNTPGASPSLPGKNVRGRSRRPGARILRTEFVPSGPAPGADLSRPAAAVLAEMGPVEGRQPGPTAAPVGVQVAAPAAQPRPLPYLPTPFAVGLRSAPKRIDFAAAASEIQVRSTGAIPGPGLSPLARTTSRAPHDSGGTEGSAEGRCGGVGGVPGAPARPLPAAVRSPLGPKLPARNPASRRESLAALVVSRSLSTHQPLRHQPSHTRRGSCLSQPPPASTMPPEAEGPRDYAREHGSAPVLRSPPLLRSALRTGASPAYTPAPEPEEPCDHSQADCCSARRASSSNVRGSTQPHTEQLYQSFTSGISLSETTESNFMSIRGSVVCSQIEEGKVWDEQVRAPTIMILVSPESSGPVQTDPGEGGADAGGKQGGEARLQKRPSYFADERDPVLEDSERAAVVVNRIFLSYVQVLALLQLPQLDPSSINGYLQFYTQITSTVAVISMDCSLPDTMAVSKATMRTIINGLSPIYISLVCWMGWVLWTAFLYIRARRGGKQTDGIDSSLWFLPGSLTYLTHVFTLTNVVVPFYFYPSAVKALLGIFDCDTVDTQVAAYPLMAQAGLNRGLYWRQDYGQECYEGAHKELVWSLGIPGMCLIGLGWPFCSALWLYLNQDKLYVDPRFTGLYSFIFEGFKPQFGWWEALISMRKLSIAALVVFLHVLDNEGLQLLVITLVLGISLALQAAYMPYEYGHGNWLEVLSLVVTITTLYFSLYFSFALTDTPLAIVTVIVIFVNVVTLAVFLYELIRANWHVQLKNFGLSPKGLTDMSSVALLAHVSSFKGNLHPKTRTVLVWAARVAQRAQRFVNSVHEVAARINDKLTPKLKSKLKRTGSAAVRTRVSFRKTDSLARQVTQ